MTTTGWWLAALALASLPGCFDPLLPAECEGRVCGSVSEALDGGSAGAVPSAMGGAGGHAGGHGGMGGHAGHGGMGSGISVAIVSPADGQAFGHGEPIPFEATVTTSGGMPDPNQLRWTSSAISEVFGIGYDFTRPLTVVGPHTITVRVLDASDNVMAQDSIQLDAL